jgi:hypothetical protein
MRKFFWSLLLLETILFVFLEIAGLRLLRITEFGAAGSSPLWSACIGVLELGIATIYIATVVIAMRGRKLLQIESLLNRLGILGMTIVWPGMVFLLYGFLAGHPAS